MTDANKMHDSNMSELNNLVNCDTDETKDEQDSFSLYEEAVTDADYIPPSLLSYFETSKNRAAVCEKLLLEESEDFTTSPHIADMINLHIELNKDMIKVNEQVICETENEEDNSSIDTHLLSASTETEALFTHSAPVCPNNEGEVGKNKSMESAKHLTFEMRTLGISLNEEERKKSIELEAEREKQHCEEMKREEQKRQIERDFQKELRKIIEAEKLHQQELELMEKRAQEKLEQEFLLQQELISNLQKRVEEERRMREEEQKRMKDEEDQRKREEEKNKMEAERKRMEEKIKTKKEEERKAEEVKLEEEKKRRTEREKKRKREEEKNKMDLEKKELEDEMKMMKEEEERKRKEEIERAKKEEAEKEKRKIEEATMEMKKEKRINKEEMSYKKEEEWRKKDEENRKKTEEENMRTEEVGRLTKGVEERKKQKEEEADERKKTTQEKMYEEMRKRDKRAHGNVDEEIKLKERKKREEEEEKEEARNREKERKNIEDKVEEVVRKQEEENRKIKELRPIEENEKRKKEDGRKSKEEEQRRRQKEEMMRQRNDEFSRKSEEEKREEEKRKREEERKNVEAEKEQNGKELRENKTEVNKKAEEIRVKEKEERESRSVQDREMKVIVVRANEVQEKRDVRENSMIGQKEKNNTDKTKSPSQLEERTTWISSSSVPLHSESAISPIRTETIPQQYDLDKNISHTSTDKAADCKNQAARPSTEFLPEHTERKRLSWMKDCISWSKLSLQNRRKQKGSVWSRRVPRRPAEAGSLPPLCPDSLLQATAWKSLQEVTTVTLEDLPGCSLSTLAQCTQLQSLSLRRCGLRSLEGINQLPQLYFIDVQENDISFVNCENMTSLRVLRLGHNKLTSIHGLTGAENVDVLDLSYNSITRIAGLESVRRLQRLSVAHNQLISTKGLRDIYTLLHLNCSHNHLASVDGLENNALLNTLDLRANSLTEPPSLNNQVLLRELHLDDNSISSLQGLTACWLPLMQHLSVAQNRITQLPSMSDSVSLENLDLRFNCMSELQNVCRSLEGCQSLRELHLAGNPLQEESGWRSTLRKAVPGLRAIDNQETDSSLSPPAVQQVSLASGSFLTFCQAQLQQTLDLQQQHSRELSKASSSLDAVKTSCRHFTEALQLATEQRFAHEYGDTTVADKHKAAGQTITEETLDKDSTNAEKRTEFPEMESTGKVPPVFSNKDNIRCSYWTSEEKSAGENQHDTFDTVTTGPKTGPTVSKANSDSIHSLETKRKTFSSNLEIAVVFNHQNLDLQNTAAVVIQQLWRKYRQKCGNISSPSTAENGGGGGGGGDGGKPESGPSYINGSVVGQNYAATVIQAFWRGFILRKRLASALAAVTCSDPGEDDTFEEVDMDEFVFDEAVLEKHWIVPLPEDLPSRSYPVSEQPLSVKPAGPFPEPPQYLLQPPPAWRSKQAWVAKEQVDSAGQRVSPVSPNRSKYPASASVVNGLSERSEKILEEWGFTNHHTALLMLKRAQNMKSKRQQQNKRREPSVRLALFRNCSYQLGPVEAGNRQAQHNRNDIKVCEAELRLQQAEKTEQVKQEGAQQWLHTRAAHSDRDSESGHFLPEISSDILNGGRVQLVADSGYTERLHHASGLWANSRSAAQLCKENNYPQRNSLGHARDEVLPPKRVSSAPSKKERISFRDNPVQLSGGWGGGKKRDKVYK